ncbi:MAG TPA: hypothetical protein DEP88_02440 [Verrucomicrobiales bacterium]|nr:hypothetical protein [Verrucomicrobiales bacterium]HCL96777.1 hypothetical protein [Verrucomicrobiales bacterium]
MNKLEVTEVAGQLAQMNDINLENVAGTGVGGRILKKDVEKAIQESSSSKIEDVKSEAKEEKVEVNASKEVAKADTSVIVSVGETPALPVGDRVVMMMIERRTGLPIRQHLKMFGADPYFLTDGVVPVVVVRVQKKKNRAAQDMYNPVLREESQITNRTSTDSTREAIPPKYESSG